MWANSKCNVPCHLPAPSVEALQGYWPLRACGSIDEQLRQCHGEQAEQAMNHLIEERERARYCASECRRVIVDQLQQ